ECISIVKKSEVLDSRMAGDRQNFLSDQHQSETFRKGGQRLQEIGEELLAAFVLIDAAHVERETARDAVLPAKAIGLKLRPRRNVRSNADDHAGHVAIAGGRLNHPPL